MLIGCGAVKSALVDFFLYAYLMMPLPKRELSEAEINDIYKKAAHARAADETNDRAKELLMSVAFSRNPSSLVFNLEKMLEESNVSSSEKFSRFAHIHS